MNETHEHDLLPIVAALKTPMSPFEVANMIRDIADGDSKKLCCPAGPDDMTLIRYRKDMTDEEWVVLSAS